MRLSVSPIVRLEDSVFLFYGLLATTLLAAVGSDHLSTFCINNACMVRELSPGWVSLCFVLADTGGPVCKAFLGIGTWCIWCYWFCGRATSVIHWMQPMYCWWQYCGYCCFFGIKLHPLWRSYCL